MDLISCTPFGPQEPQSSVDQMRSDPDVTVRVCFTFWVSQWQLVELLTSTVKVSVSPTWGFLVSPVTFTDSCEPSHIVDDADGVDAKADGDGDSVRGADLLGLTADELAEGVADAHAVSVHDGSGVNDEAAGAADSFDPPASLAIPAITNATTTTTTTNNISRRTQYVCGDSGPTGSVRPRNGVIRLSSGGRPTPPEKRARR